MTRTELIAEVKKPGPVVMWVAPGELDIGIYVKVEKKFLLARLNEASDYIFGIQCHREDGVLFINKSPNNNDPTIF